MPTTAPTERLQGDPPLRLTMPPSAISMFPPNRPPTGHPCPAHPPALWSIPGHHLPSWSNALLRWHRPQGSVQPRICLPSQTANVRYRKTRRNNGQATSGGVASGQFQLAKGVAQGIRCPIGRTGLALLSSAPTHSRGHRQIEEPDTGSEYGK